MTLGMLPADAAGGHCAISADVKEQVLSASCKVDVEANLASKHAAPALLSTCKSNGPKNAAHGGQDGPEAGGGPAPRTPPSEEDDKELISNEDESSQDSRDCSSFGPDEIGVPQSALLASLADENFDTIFEDPTLAVGLDDHAATAVSAMSTEDTALIIRNLNTGEVLHVEQLGDRSEDRVLENDSPDKSSQKLGKLKGKPWKSWYSDKERKDKKLWHAVEAGDASILREVLAPPTDGSAPVVVNVRLLHGRTPLHVAAHSGALDCLEVLLHAGADPCMQTDAGLTPLHVAAQRGHIGGVRLLLEAGANVLSETEDRNLAVHLASANGHIEVIVLLIEKGGPDQLGVRNQKGQRPAESAADLKTAGLFKKYRDDVPKSPRSGEAWESEVSPGKMSVASFGEDDGYAGRTVYDGAVLLRNARSDAVHRLLQRTKTEIDVDDISSNRSPTGEPRVDDMASKCSPRRDTRAPFSQLKEGDDAEKVGPSSFELVKLLGRGAFGEVSQVKHTKSGQMYAMKVLKKQRVLSSNLLRYAKTERNILAYVKHPYIVSLHYAFQTSRHLVLVLQYCPRGNLQRLISREKRLRGPLACIYTAEIQLALAHLHDRQTVFRDLKPDNVVIDADYHAMLTDFGLSKEGVNSARGAKSFCGSVAFLAPEILARSGHGHTVDIYGLGVILYDMLTGQPPFYHPDKETLLSNIEFAPLEVPHYVPAAARSLIITLMEREPSRRLGAVNTMDIQSHDYFRNIDFDALMRREIPVPISNENYPLVDSHPRNDAPLSQVYPGAPESLYGRPDPAAGCGLGGWFTRPQPPQPARDNSTRGAVTGWDIQKHH